MNTDKSFWKDSKAFLRSFFAEPLTIYTLIIALSISIFIVLEAVYPQFATWASGAGFYWVEEHYPIFATDDDRKFSQGFVEWFGVFYGFFLPLLLIRSWEQIDKADREFDREADSIKVLLEDVMLLDNKDFLPLKINMVRELAIYVQHVMHNYPKEHERDNTSKELKELGDKILQGIRTNYRELIYRGGGKRASQLEPLTTELLERLNDAIDVRGDRISIFGQRLFQSLRIVAVITSIIWLIPFYFLDFQSGILGSLLKLAVTFLIIFILSIIDDLDEPFAGTWKISLSTWKEVQKETNSSLGELQEQENQARKKRKAITKIVDSFVNFLWEFADNKKPALLTLPQTASNAKRSIRISIP